MVAISGLIYVGNHGLEVESPNSKIIQCVSQMHRAILEDIKERLEKAVSGIEGSLVEDKAFSIALHFRLVAKKDASKVKAAFHDAVAPYVASGQITPRRGKMVLEARFAFGRNKGDVALWLASRYADLFGRGNLELCYVGDDDTDEDAFEALNRQGITVLVGRRRRSAAEYYVKNTDEVGRLLAEFVGIYKGDY
jgi:trehalose-phosphatase